MQNSRNLQVPIGNLVLSFTRVLFYVSTLNTECRELGVDTDTEQTLFEEL